MSYIKVYLPELAELKSKIETNFDVLRYYSKYDGFVGSSESVDYLTKKLEEYDDLTLVNPKVTETSDDMVMYIEKDSVKSKNRKTIRHKSFSVETDNLGLVQFASDKTEWKSNDEFFNDMGLFESVVAQRLIDAIDGIDITDKIRAYSQQLKAEKTPGRNERVMVQSPDGEMEFMKYKKAEPLLERGYQLV
jgi:peptide deformylase